MATAEIAIKAMVTLVSAAHGYLLLGRLADSVADDWVAQYV